MKTFRAIGLCAIAAGLSMIALPLAAQTPGTGGEGSPTLVKPSFKPVLSRVKDECDQGFKDGCTVNSTAAMTACRRGGRAGRGGRAQGCLPEDGGQAGLYAQLQMTRRT